MAKKQTKKKLKMNNKICTSIEQSKKLIELGIDVDTADMCHRYRWSNNSFINLPCAEKARETITGDIPAWSLTALIDLMPNKISINNETYYLSFTKKSVSFRGPVTWDGQKAKSFEMDNIFDAAFEMICWLKENGKI